MAGLFITSGTGAAVALTFSRTSETRTFATLSSSGARTFTSFGTLATLTSSLTSETGTSVTLASGNRISSAIDSWTSGTRFLWHLELHRF